MTLLAPLALTALLPWAWLAWRCLRGRATPAGVPFLALWPADAARATRRRRRPPPAFLTFALLAALLAVVAAARPMIFPSRGGTSDLIVVVDRGDTMSLTRTDGRTRLAAFAEDHADLLSPLRGASYNVLHVPAGATETNNLTAAPTAADTAADLRRTVRDALATNGGVLVVSDRAPDLVGNGRVFFVGPTQSPPANIGIESVAVAPAPADSAALVTLRNDSDFEETPLTLTTAAGSATRRVRLPPRGETRRYALDFPPGPADAAVVELPADAWPPDNRYAVARRRAWPDAVASPDAAAGLRRVVRLFRDLRPPRPYSRRVTVGPAADATILIPPAGRPTEGDWKIAADEIAAGVTWPALRQVRAAAYPFAGDADWRPIVRRGAGVLLAINESDRRAWVGFAAEGFEQTPAFVRLWADLLTWANGGPEAWASQAIANDELATLTPAQAAVAVDVSYDSTGRPAATHAPVVRPAAAEKWDADALKRWLIARRIGVELSPWLVLGALACAAASALLWPKRKRG